MTLETYLRTHLDKGVIDFSIRAEIRLDTVTFYIHPDGKDGDTHDYEVTGYSVVDKEFYENLAKYVKNSSKKCPICKRNIGVYKNGNIRNHKCQGEVTNK